MNNAHSTILDEEGWGNLRLHILLANADRCFSRLATIVMNGLRRGGSLKKYVRDTTAEAEIRHLRIRLEIYNTALGAPIMLSVVYEPYFLLLESTFTNVGVVGQSKSHSAPNSALLVSIPSLAGSTSFRINAQD